MSLLLTVGCNLKNLDLDSCTLSEILRLHILASGADVTSANAKYRYQKRGGFDATDDACMELRLSNPGLLKKLSCTSVYDLSSGNKAKGISPDFMTGALGLLAGSYSMITAIQRSLWMSTNYEACSSAASPSLAHYQSSVCV